MADELEPLGPLAKRVLESGVKETPGEDDAMRERVLSRLTASIAALPPAPTTTPAASVAKATFAAKAAPWIAAAFLAGGAVGAGVHAALTPAAAPDKPIAVLPPPSITAATRAAEPNMPAMPVIPIGSLPSMPTTPIPSSSTAPAHSASIGDSDLAAERALVDRARMALARGQSDAALEALGNHASTFPKGRLAEERDALTVQALAQAGRKNDAKARAARFHVEFPNSVLGAAVDSTAEK